MLITCTTVYCKFRIHCLNWKSPVTKVSMYIHEFMKQAFPHHYVIQPQTRLLVGPCPDAYPCIRPSNVHKIISIHMVLLFWPLTTFVSSLKNTLLQLSCTFIKSQKNQCFWRVNIDFIPFVGRDFLNIFPRASNPVSVVK